MMSMYRRFSQLLKSRACAVLFTICLISPFLVVSASAESIFADAFFRGSIYCGTSPTTFADLHFTPSFTVPIPRQGDLQYFDLDTNVSSSYYYIGFGVKEFSVTSVDESGFFGNVGFYLSYYARLGGYSVDPLGLWQKTNAPFKVQILNGNNEIIQIVDLQPEYFVPNSSEYGTRVSDGVHVSFTVNVPEETPVLKILFTTDYSTPVQWVCSADVEPYNGMISYVIPSAVLVAERTTAELKELENISNAILEQNNLSSQYFGDVISKVDSLYTEVGNLADLQEQAIQQFDDWNIVSSVPGSVQNKVDKADQVISDINSLVKPDPELLVPSFDADTDDISSIFEPFFKNALIVQLCTMVLGFAFVSYVLFGKKG